MAIILLIVGISLLILLHELGHFLAAKHYGIQVEEFGFGFPPRLFSKKIGDTVYSFNLLPFGGFVRLYGESMAQLNFFKSQAAEKGKEYTIYFLKSFVHQKVWRRFVVISAGIAMNFFLGWAIMSIVFMMGAPQSIVVSEVVEDSPAAIAGLQIGDRISGFYDSQAFINYLNRNGGDKVTLTFHRDFEEMETSLTPRTNQRVIEQEGAIGVAIIDTGFQRKSFFAAIWDGLVSSLTIMAQIIKALFLLIVGIFTGGAISETVVGPIGVFAIANDLSNLGFVYILQLIGLISLNLAILNALPIPALDGGRILFLILEKLKGKRLNANREIMANALGFGLLVLFMLAITVRDVIQLF